MENPNKKSPILQLVILSSITLFTAFLFACEQELDTFENNDDVSHYKFSKEDLENEISEKVSRLNNVPQDIIDKYISAQRKNPQYLYMPDINLITEKQSASFTLEKLKSLKSLGGLELEIDYSRMLTQEETNIYFSQEKISKKNIASSYAIIRKVDRLRHLEHRHKMNYKDNSIHDDYDKKASFKGGMQALAQHLKENLNYPELAREKGIEDKLVMRFVVNKGGGLLYLNIDQEPSTTDEEISLEFQIAAYRALRVTEGNWEPAEKDGKYVMSKMTLPIEFKLDN